MTLVLPGRELVEAGGLHEPTSPGSCMRVVIRFFLRCMCSRCGHTRVEYTLRNNNNNNNNNRAILVNNYIRLGREVPYTTVAESPTSSTEILLAVVQKRRVPAVQTVQPTVEIPQVPFLDKVNMPVVVHDRCVAFRPCDHAATSSSRVTVGVLLSVHRQSGGIVVERDRYFGARTGSSSTSLLTPGFNLDAPTQFSHVKLALLTDDDEGLGDDDDFLGPAAANEESQVEQIVASCHRPRGTREGDTACAMGCRRCGVATRTTRTTRPTQKPQEPHEAQPQEPQQFLRVLHSWQFAAVFACQCSWALDDEEFFIIEGSV